MIAKASGLVSIPERSVLGRRGAAALRGNHNVQRPAKRASEGR